jgi:hypothetical protein
MIVSSPLATIDIENDEDYIGCDYYGRVSYASLVIAHTSQVTSTNSRTTYNPGTLVIVAAQGDDRNIYAFLATAIEVLSDKTAIHYWPTERPNPVNKLKVLTPIMLLPDTCYSSMTQGGLRLIERAVCARYLRDEAQIVTPLPKPEVEPQPDTVVRLIKETTGKIGYVYILRNRLGEGYKIGITANIHQRFKALEVGTKADCIGYWSSENYKNLESFLHGLFTPARVPQSEWFMLSPHQLEFSIAWLDENSTPIDIDYPVTVDKGNWFKRLIQRVISFIKD